MGIFLIPFPYIQSLMRKATPVWKVVLAVFSLLLTVLVWQQGLEESFDRPSVTPRLSLNQHEIAFLAKPSIPPSLQNILVGADPESSLQKILKEIPADQLNDRERILSATLEKSHQIRRDLLQNELQTDELIKLKNLLLDSSNKENFSSDNLKALSTLDIDPILYRTSCQVITGQSQSNKCIDFETSQIMAFKLITSQLLPFLASLLGIGFLIRQGWISFRKQNQPWPDSAFLPFSVIEMILLIAGGFVVLGEVITPIFTIPITAIFIRDLSIPIKESIKIFVGYCSMALPPLIILSRLFTTISKTEPPDGGWLQWRVKPVLKVIFQGFKGFLMVIPLVLLTSWLTDFVWGDQGGSNPLLEMVLQGNNSFALFILFLVTVVMAPLFEELIFRGALLPVLVRRQGKILGILVSALVFALAHLSVGELLPLFVLGIGLASLRLSSGRLLSCVIMHSLWNGFTFANLLLLGN